MAIKHIVCCSLGPLYSRPMCGRRLPWRWRLYQANFDAQLFEIPPPVFDIENFHRWRVLRGRNCLSNLKWFYLKHVFSAQKIFITVISVFFLLFSQSDARNLLSNGKLKILSFCRINNLVLQQNLFKIPIVWADSSTQLADRIRHLCFETTNLFQLSAMTNRMRSRKISKLIMVPRRTRSHFWTGSLSHLKLTHTDEAGALNKFNGRILTNRLQFETGAKLNIIRRITIQ